MKKEKRENFNFKRRIALGLILLMIAYSAFCIAAVYALPDGVEIEYLYANAESYAYGLPYQNKLFYDDNGTIWNIYSRSTSTKLNQLEWSIDGGATWDDTGLTWTSPPGCFAYPLEWDAIYRDGYLYCMGAGRSAQYYMFSKYTISTDGTMTLVTATTSTAHSEWYRYGTAAVDSDGYVYYFTLNEHLTTRSVLIKNGNNDGTFAMASGYPEDINTGMYKTNILLMLSDDNLVMIAANGTAAELYLYDTDLKEIVYMDTITEDIADHTAIAVITAGQAGAINAVIDDDDLTHIVWRNDDSDIMYCTYSNSTGISEAVELATAQSNSYPFVSFDPVANDLYVSWCEAAIHSIKYTNLETWGSEETLTETLTSLDDNDLVRAFRTIPGDYYGHSYREPGSYNPWYVATEDLDPDRSPPSTPTVSPSTVWLWLTDRTSLWLGILGVFMVTLSPLFLVKSFKDGDVTGFGIALLIMTTVGAALIVGWLYG